MTQSTHDKKKHRVIHTRVSEQLEEELKERAQELGVSVSNLVRNALHNAVDLAHGLVDDAAEIAIAGAGSRKTASAPATAPVLGWQELTLNLNALCKACNAILPKGQKASVAVTATGTAPEFMCAQCVTGLGAKSE